MEPETTSLRDALAAAEAELDTLAEQTRAAYKAYRIADDQQAAKGTEVRELRRQIREGAAK